MKTKGDYLKSLESGHTILTEEYAKEVCEAFGVPFSKRLNKQQYDSSHGISNKSGDAEQGLRGVWDLDLLYYLAKKLGVDVKNDFHGYGFQAEYIVNEIKKVMLERLLAGGKYE